MLSISCRLYITRQMIIINGVSLASGLCMWICPLEKLTIKDDEEATWALTTCMLTTCTVAVLKEALCSILVLDKMQDLLIKVGLTLDLYGIRRMCPPPDNFPMQLIRVGLTHAHLN